MLDMFTDGSLGLAKQLSKLFLRQPESFSLQHDIYLGAAVLATVNQELAGFIFHWADLQLL